MKAPRPNDEPLRQYHKQDCLSFSPGWDCDCGFSEALETYFARREEAAYKCPWCEVPAESASQLKTHIDMRHRPDSYAPDNYVTKAELEAAVLAGQLHTLEKLSRKAFLIEGVPFVGKGYIETEMVRLQAEQVKLNRKDGER